MKKILIIALACAASYSFAAAKFEQNTYQPQPGITVVETTQTTTNPLTPEPPSVYYYQQTTTYCVMSDTYKFFAKLFKLNLPKECQ
ncbi:MAG: hypothetical protein IJ566_01270 [Cardiobacteriaceae bacterium]|nr:hypothetical protein [Cardiobacteriaceae bacterium]